MRRGNLKALCECGHVKGWHGLNPSAKKGACGFSNVGNMAQPCPCPKFVGGKQGRYRVSPKADRTVDGVVFDSKAEARRWIVLREREREGKITNLTRQFSFPIYINGKLIFTYKADFVYLLAPTSLPGGAAATQIIEDVKGHRTEVYRIKKKAVEAQYGIGIAEVKA